MTEIIIKVCDRFLEEAKSKGMDGKNILIRCKDCEYWYAGENINYCRKFWDDDGEPKLYRCTADDFCSRAERKEE